MKKKTAIAIVVVDIIILVIVYLAIKKYEGNNKETFQDEVEQVTQGETLVQSDKSSSNHLDDEIVATDGSGNNALIGDNFSENPTLMNKSGSLRGENTCAVNEDIQYRLRIVDAAGPDKFYDLEKSMDGGKTWQIINENPIKDYTGVSNGIYFMNVDVGFIVLTRNGGSEGKLFRTEDGGNTFSEVIIPPADADFIVKEGYDPFDTPDVPFTEDGRLVLFVEQGQDGDYKNGISAMYVSDDMGQTWTFEKEGQMQYPYNG